MRYRLKEELTVLSTVNLDIFVEKASDLNSTKLWVTNLKVDSHIDSMG